MSIVIEGLYIFDEQHNCILEHIYGARPPKSQELISRYLKHPVPQPSVLQLQDVNPPTTAYSFSHSDLLLVCTCSADSQPLAILEFLHRLVDILEDFLGSPLLSNKIEDNYEVVAQVLAEVCDGGVVCNTEPNALKELVEVSSLIGKLFNQVGIPSTSSASNQPTSLAAALKASSSAASGPAIPWRKPNVRHTSNELYVDIVESLNVIFAPSGRPISARSNGSIAFTAKISGVPDLILTLSAPGGTSSAKSSGIARTMQLPVFHPCVRLARWKEQPGELSFVPPDGRFMLAGYEVDLLPYSLNDDVPPSRAEKLFLPATVDMKTGLGQSGTDFEARLTLNNNFPGTTTSKLNPGRSTSSTAPFSFGASNTGTSGAPTLEVVVVTIPLPPDVRNVTDLKPSRGDATFNYQTKIIEWKIPTKDGQSINGTATLTGSIVGNISNMGGDDDLEVETDPIKLENSNAMAGYYDEEQASQTTRTDGLTTSTLNSGISRQHRSQASKKALMPRSIAVSFSVKGWLPSGIKVDGLMVDAKKSKGLGDGVKPFKGVKYLTVSRQGVERRISQTLT